MKKTRVPKSLLCTLCAAISALVSLPANAQVTNWVAYNDHTPGTTAGWSTAPNTTTYNMRGISGGNAGTVLSGNLKDFTSGSSVAAVLTSSAIGTPDDFGSSGYPNAGTPAYDLFNGKVDLGNSQSMIGVRSSSGSSQILTFSNLDPSKRYILKGTSVRGNNYNGRWTLVSLQGVDGFTEDHSAEVYTAANYASAGLTNGQAGYHSGENRANGAVVGWKDINPGPDGTFNVFCQQWTANPLPNGAAPDTANYGYGFNGIMLAEVEVGTLQPPSIVTEPSNVTTNEGSVARLSVAASGSGSLAYQWYRNGSPVSGGTASTLTVTNMNGTSRFPWSAPSDSGSYYVVVTGALNPPAQSQTVQVTVNPDTNAPRAVWAVVDTNVVRILLSEPLTNALTDYADFLAANLNWSIDPISGPGGTLNSPDVDLYLTNNEIHLVYSVLPFDSNTVYAVTYNGNTLWDRAETGNGAAALSVPLNFHEQVVLPMDKLWKYSDKDVAAPANWFTKNFDDSDTSFWSTGPGVLDAKRQSTQPWCRSTLVNSLTNSIGTCLVLSNANATGDTPTYYFRTHFNFTGTSPSNALLRMFGKFDDAAVVYLNGVEIDRVGVPVGTHPHNAFVGGLRSVGDGDAPDVAILSPGSALVTGDNVIAVELRQVNATSSDITMALQVTAATSTASAQPAHLTISTSNNQVSVSWTPSGGSLLEANNITGPWTTNGAASNPHVFTPPAGASQKFFRVAQ